MNQKDENGIGQNVKTSDDPAEWIDEHGDYLFSFAMARLQDEDAAVVVVQQTFFLP